MTKVKDIVEVVDLLREENKKRKIKHDFTAEQAKTIQDLGDVAASFLGIHQNQVRLPQHQNSTLNEEAGRLLSELKKHLNVKEVEKREKHQLSSSY